MRSIAAALGLALAGEMAAHGAAAPEPPDFGYVLQRLQPTHPRIFLNQEILQRVKREGLTPEQQQWLAALKEKVESYPAPPPIDEKLVAFMMSEEGGRRYGLNDPPRVNVGNWGTCGAHAALAYLLTGERRHYDRALGYLKHAAGVYNVVLENKREPLGHSWDRLAAISTFDWLYNDIPEPERESVGKALFTPLYAFYRRCRGEGQKPFMWYSDEILGWYLGLVYLGTGASGVSDDALVKTLEKEYGEYVAVLRERAVGQDGVALFGAIGYITQLLQTEVNFFDSWRTAVGGSFLRYLPTRALLPNYFLWNTIPTGPSPLSFGWSDAYHTDNRMDIAHRQYLMRVPDLNAELAREVNLEGLGEISQFQVTTRFGAFLDLDSHLTSASPLYFSAKPYTEAQIQAVLKRLPRARFFPDPVGHLFMNSGWGESDTYAMFVAGRQSFYRKHFDENHFTIYKKGFLALDSGARGYSGGRPRSVGDTHESNYYFDTVAHNAVLIQMEGEKLPGAWGQASDCNTGGMNKNHGAQVRAFETNDRYTYVASDATACYHEGKAQEVVRQFLFLYPDHFVVFDRVASKTPQQKKTWLVHTQHEPQAQGDTFSAEHREGRMFVRTLLPEAPRFEKIGGPGKEFWADGRNWPVREDWQHLTPDQHVFGCYRMEVSAGQENQRELFLHLIQVGDRQEVKAMTPSRRVAEGQEVGVEFQAGNATVRVLFNRDGDVGGRIRIAEGSNVLMERALARSVMPQSGLALAEPE
ncbi:MAG: heparinase II/III family protein [Armatimonadetes bacterium]|nr:heparinase II/III family protein [Armatimonadota bacterium]